MNKNDKQKIILIGGMLATGKTTLAKSLYEKLKLPYFYKDILKEKLGEAIGFSNREENLKLSKGAFLMLYSISEQLVANHSSFILESNFRQNELDDLEKLFLKNNYEIISIKLSGDIDVLYQRYLHRFECENRNPVHANFSSYEEFKEYQINVNQVNYPGKVIELDATNFIDVNACINLLGL